MDVLGKYVVMIMSVVDMYIQDVDLLAVAYFIGIHANHSK